MAKTLSDYVQDALKTVNEVEQDQVFELVEKEGYQILDVREPDEYEEGHLPGAYNVPRGFLEVRADHEHYKQDPKMQDRSQKFICYCGGGHRSSMACKTLLEMGFADALSLKGGWTDWTENGGSVEK